MTKIGVHGAKIAIAATQSLAKTGFVGCAQPCFGRSVEHMDARIVNRQFIGNLPRAVGRIVIDN